MLRKDPFITGEYYHIYNRGIDKRVIFTSESDFERFLMLLYVANSTESFRLDQLINYQHKTFAEIFKLDTGVKLVSIGAWCLMTNHFHILLKQEVDGGISKFMKKIGTAYSMYFNIKYQRQGALFGGPFKSKLIGVDDNYLQHLFGYIHLNTLDLQFPDWEDTIEKPSNDMKRFLDGYRFSSYLDYTAGPRPEMVILNEKPFEDVLPEYFLKQEGLKSFVEHYFMQGLSLREK